MTKDRLYYACQIRYWRKVRDIPPKELGRLVKAHENTIYRWESAVCLPSVIHWHRLQTILAIPYSPYPR
jgi:ribosome-binding protein aMBF1 (putative translation factor)